MRAHINRYLLLSIAITAMAFAGCNGSSSSTPSGMFSLSISDTPVDGATSVVVTFTGVEIQPAGGKEGDGSGDDDSGGDSGGMMGSGDMGSGDSDDNSAKPLTFTFASPHQIDLMQQQGGNSASLLSGISLPAGRYAWIRLMVASTGNTITLSDGSVHTLTIPSGDETGLKLVHGFTVAEGGVVDFTIDFDLRRSVILANGQYILKPVLRLMDNLDVGRISGSVANTFMIGTTAITDPTCMPAAYIYAGTDVVPVDINPTATVQPVATATVKLDDASGGYVCSAGFLAPGIYTVALVCAAADNPATADALTFSAPKDATIASDMTATVDFP